MDFGAMNDLVKQAQEMQKKIGDMQDQLTGRMVTATAGGGMVTVTANGAGELIAVRLEREIINPNDPEMLGDLVLAAANEALKKSREMVSQEMSRLTGGLNLPGLFGK
ncbi:MAG: YbaB/EbfC family nucleoid-associated protein [Candidatus Adiutrix sp.]|jgi:DNA-binding YbaB/EbfC family protein|nr:YbaB/EbfC family nucleoid-associated protein [Candidatus Adiutrix sp.]